MTIAWAVLSLASILVPEIREPARDPAVLQALWQMFERAHYGHGAIEEAAFVIVAPDGALSLLSWPLSGSPHRSRWSGPLPANAIAIVHTHPNRWPDPSPRDEQTAVETRLAVYVITRSGIVKTTGAATEIIAKARWWSPRRQPRTELAQQRTHPAAVARTR